MGICSSRTTPQKSESFSSSRSTPRNSPYKLKRCRNCGQSLRKIKHFCRTVPILSPINESTLIIRRTNKSR